MSSGLDFTTIARVRAILDFDDSDTSKDAELARLITQISGAMEDQMIRNFKIAENVDVVSNWYPNRLLRLRAPPVLLDPAPVVIVSNTRVFDVNALVLRLGVDYVLEEQIGMLRLLLQPEPFRDPVTMHAMSPTYYQVTYTGGMIDSTPNFMVKFPALAEACELQVAYRCKRRTIPGGGLVVGGSSSQYTGNYDFLPSVQRAIEFHKLRTVPQ